MKKAADEAVKEAAFEKGESKGRLEKGHEIALKMLKRNRPLEEISEDTGLSLEEIKSLQK